MTAGDKNAARQKERIWSGKQSINFRISANIFQVSRHWMMSASISWRGRFTQLSEKMGAGKSTLMNIISGVYQPSSGSLVFEGERLELKSVSHAQDMGISMHFIRNFPCPRRWILPKIYLRADFQKGRAAS